MICWTRGSSRVKSRPGGFVNPGGEDSTMFHQQVPALKTTFPFGPSYTTAANDGGLLDRGVVEDLRAGDDNQARVVPQGWAVIFPAHQARYPVPRLHASAGEEPVIGCRHHPVSEADPVRARAHQLVLVGHVIVVAASLEAAEDAIRRASRRGLDHDLAVNRVATQKRQADAGVACARDVVDHRPRPVLVVADRTGIP